MILIFAGALTLGLIIPIVLLLLRLHRRKRRDKKMSRLSCVVVTAGDVVVPPQQLSSAPSPAALPNGQENHDGAARLPAIGAGRSNAGAANAAAANAAARRAPPPPPATVRPEPFSRCAREITLFGATEMKFSK